MVSPVFGETSLNLNNNVDRWVIAGVISVASMPVIFNKNDLQDTVDFLNVTGKLFLALFGHERLEQLNKILQFYDAVSSNDRTAWNQHNNWFRLWSDFAIGTIMHKVYFLVP